MATSLLENAWISIWTCYDTKYCLSRIKVHLDWVVSEQNCPNALVKCSLGPEWSIQNKHTEVFHLPSSLLCPARCYWPLRTAGTATTQLPYCVSVQLSMERRNLTQFPQMSSDKKVWTVTAFTSKAFCEVLFAHIQIRGRCLALLSHWQRPDVFWSGYDRPCMYMTHSFQ